MIQIHPDINAIYARLKIRDHTKNNQGEWKAAELSAESTGKGLNKVFKVLVNKLKNSFSTLGESGSVVSYFIPELKNFSEFTRLPTEVKKAWLKQTLKEIKSLINN